MESMTKVVAVVQARMGSTRFPGKVMELVGGHPMIGLLVERLRLAGRVDSIVVATSTDRRNDLMVEYVTGLGVSVFRGSENDVLARYHGAAQEFGADVVVRITGDCPLVDPAVVDAVVDALLDSDAVYASNVSPPTFPDGLDVEAFRFPALDSAFRDATLLAHREHVTPYIRESGAFTQVNVATQQDLSGERWTVDEREDLEVIRNVCRHFEPRRDFGWEEVADLLTQHPKMFLANRHLVRNEGSCIGTGQKLWKRAKRVIPGGNMLLSKRSEMFLPEQWPSYFSRAKGCKVWDLDNNEFTDMTIMGIGTNILGYGHPEVDAAVHQTVIAGNMSTLNCPEEVYLAERLIELHPWAEMARFARSGGEANAIAIRIARAASGKHKVAFCGYHGWHDWYLAANLSGEKTLAGHLLPGLEPSGVPDSLRDTIYPFTYNRLDELEELLNSHDIGVIKMEVRRNAAPAEGFLEKVRELATARGVVLIFDECTSGFRQTFGGLHKLYGVEPDMAMFGKALGNGYAITAIIGRKNVMEAAQSSFISSTFWTERIGPSAALKTLDVMERIKSWDYISATGNTIKERWLALAKKHGLAIDIWGLPALAGYSFTSEHAAEYKTLTTQEMLAKGYLAGNSVYVSTEHTAEVLEGYFQELDHVFALISDCENGRDVASLLHGPVCHSGFKRLN
jgi:glutamate-1-semialdehyde 2,1-aminomutase